MILPLAVAVVALLAQNPAASQPAQAGPSGIPDCLRVQAALDRAGFSPGVIDGHMGANTRRALDEYRKQRGDLNTNVEPLTKYRITDQDAAGPFEEHIPSGLAEQSKMQSLGYRNPLEELAERFHATPALLQHLNPSATWTAGEEIVVPNVQPLVMPAPALPANPNPQPKGTSGRSPSAQPAAPPKPDVIVTVSKTTSALTVTDTGGRVLMYAPVTTGSEHDPLPIGEWKVTGMQFNPKFRYDPALFWDAPSSDQKAVLPTGPNSPVGIVWIDVSKEHYGLHGTPEPSTIGKTQSHGCVRLTNWDALKLAGLVKPGTKVIFTD